MIPVEYTDELQNDFTIITQPTRTYRLNFTGKPSTGMLDGVEAMKQAIYMILYSERYVYEMFSWNYGVEFWPCFQESDPVLAMAKVETAIREALLQDDRITAVDSFSFEPDETNKKALHVTFNVLTTEGNVESDVLFSDNGMEVVS